MPFRVTARTLLHLGSELISSDGVAFYELIKNAIDAGSQRVRIDIVSRLPYRSLKEWMAAIGAAKHDMETAENRNDFSEEECLQAEALAVDTLCANIATCVDLTAPEARLFQAEIKQAHTWNSALEVLKRANYIIIADTGEGMSLEDLDQVYLTIGTTSRRKERVKQEQGRGANASHPILGEKGVGRLSAMRLGRYLQVRTSRQGETHWNALDIDWSRFSHDSDALISEVEVVPARGGLKDDPATSGTIITIWDLEDEWSKEKLREIARNEFSRLTDPFTPRSRYPIMPRFNGEAILIPTIANALFDAAHAQVEAQFDVDGETASLSGRIKYQMRGREKTFLLQGVELTSITNLPITTLQSLGPFHVHFYWYNRRILEAIEDIGDSKQVLALVNNWAGGLMVFRDGFRVNPYGSGEDDWLKLDRSAFGASGYKVNKQQIIGKVDLSSVQNPRLVDQTNREGLRDCDEKRALIWLLRHILITEFRTFLDQVDARVDAKEPISVDTLEQRVQQQKEALKSNLDQLILRVPEIKQEPALVSSIRRLEDDLQVTMSQVKEMTISYGEGRSQLVHLAGLGLMVEFLAHELNRTTGRALSTLSGLLNDNVPVEIRGSFTTLEEQLKTLQKRLRILDPLDTRSRQIKSRFDLIEWIRDILIAHTDQFARHHIQWSLVVQPPKQHATLQVNAVKGMFVQILENLISNSVYWIKQQQKMDAGLQPKIEIVIDMTAKELRFTDNGPGVDPSRREQIFQAFVTTKPPGEGKGLGLFISREIANFNGYQMFLSERPSIHANRLNTFILDLETTTR